ncbi:MAG TPA: glycosyltransferase [Gammaproteobacteria bacterium]
MRPTLLSVNNYHYPRGGADIVFLRHNEMLAELGWTVVPFCMRHPSNRPTSWDAHFVDEIELGRDYPLGEKLRKGLKGVYSFEARAKIGELIRLASPDVCHAHNVYHHLSPSVLAAVKQSGIPLVMTLHDLKLACPAYSMLSHGRICERCRNGGLFHVALRRCMKGSLPLSLLVMAESYLHRLLNSYVGTVDRFVVPSRFYLRKLAEWGFHGEQFRYVPNFVDASRTRPAFDPGRRFVYFGRLSREKGLDTLVRAAARARVGADLIGTGPELDRLEALAAHIGADVRFLGFLSGRELESAIADARAVVVPSEWYENAPLSVLEAYALGKPVIASRIGGLPELVEHDETGWLFEAGDADALGLMLSHVRALPDQALRVAGERARAKVATDFSPHRYLERVAGLYAELGVRCG